MNEFIRLTDLDTKEQVFIASDFIKTILQLQADANYGRRTVINGSIVVYEEATEIALATGRGFIDKKDFKQPEYSKTHKRFSELLDNPEVLSNPEEFLGPNFEAVLNYWLVLDGLSEEQWKTIQGRYRDFRDNQWSEWLKAIEEVDKASEETIGREFTFNAGCAACFVYGSAAYYATMEHIGGVKNPVFLPMFDNL